MHGRNTRGMGSQGLKNPTLIVSILVHKVSDIKGAVSRQSSTFGLILPITHPQSLRKVSKEITCKCNIRYL